LRVITRSDLTHATQACQVAHAVADFCNENPHLAKAWQKESNSIIILTVPDERALYDFCEKNSGLDYTEFREPDLGYELTAIALHPCEEARRKTSNLPLAMKGQGQEGASKQERKLKNLIREMRQCEQTPGQSVLDHGWSVRNHAMDLLGGRSLYEWKIPDWFPLDLKFDAYVLDKYTIFHDCGKPNCRIIDKEGKHHFPNHAQISSFVWMSLFEDEMEIADLIARDMEIHTMSADNVPKFCRDPKTARMLTVVGLAELHSNAGMFGGIESTSFKIKYKQWNRRAKQVFQITEVQP